MSIQENDVMSIQIGDVTLFYTKTDGPENVEYFTTFIAEYNPKLNEIISFLAESITPLYSTERREGGISHSNDDRNSQRVCDWLSNDENPINYGIKYGRLTIINWAIDKEECKNIKKIYGIKGMGTSHLSLLYVEITIDDIAYKIAVDTGSDILQFYVGTDSDFDTIIKKRYQCMDFKIINDCETSYLSAAYPELYKGGKRNLSKQRLSRRKRSKSRSKRIRKKSRQRK